MLDTVHETFQILLPKILLQVEKADIFTVMVDESTDISMSKKMVVYVRYTDEDFDPHILTF